MHAIIDRIENNVAICLESHNRQKKFLLYTNKLPKPIAEGQSIVYYDREWHLDNIRQMERKKRLRKIMQEVFI